MIELTKVIDGKSVKLDLISLDGKTYVRPESWEAATKIVTAAKLKAEGYEKAPKPKEAGDVANEEAKEPKVKDEQVE